MALNNITDCGAAELSLHVLNTEPLYLAFRRCADREDLRQLADQHFVYTDDQFEELCDDHSDDQNGGH